MTSDLVSVVIPTYNRAFCVAATVDSVLAQSHRAVEAIVVDDGSTDNTEAVMSRYRGDARVRYIRQTNGGVSSARNRGFQAATGAYVALLDSDDRWLPWKLEAQLACLRHFGVEMVCSDMSAVDGDGRVTHPVALNALYHAWQRFPLDELFDRSAVLGAIAPGVGPAGARAWAGDALTAAVLGNLVCTSTMLMTRGCRERVGPYDETLVPAGEDYEFDLRVCGDGPMCLLDASTTLYRYGESDQITRRTLALAVNYLRVLEPALHRYRGRIRLTDAAARRAVADACAWIGNEFLAAGRGRESAAHYRRAVALGRRDLQTLLRLMLAAAPAPARDVALRAYHSLKPRRGGASGGGGGGDGGRRERH